ncbi:hypothetical protein ACQVTZ_29315 [Bacillus cereus]
MYLKIKRKKTYLFHVVDSEVDTVDFYLSQSENTF